MNSEDIFISTPAASTETEPQMLSDAQSTATAGYLKHLYIQAFGAFFERDIGPFAPGLNVIYGPNEAGKTTISSCIDGVLFGWPEARGVRNTYQPEHAERSATLVFASKEHPEHTYRATRTKNAQGLIQDNIDVLADIDERTFRSVFRFSSAELTSLSKHTDLTARLLTATSGTRISPAQATDEITNRVNALWSRSKQYDQNIYHLKSELTEVTDELTFAREAQKQLRKDDAEYHEIAARIDEMHERFSAINEQIAQLTSAIDALTRNSEDARRLDERMQAIDAQISEASRDEERFQEKLAAPERTYPLLSEEESDELSDELENLIAERAREEQTLSIAKTDYQRSSAAYEALQESNQTSGIISTVTKKRTIQISLSVILPAFFALLGAPIFIHGRDIGSLSVTTLGILLVASALFALLGAFVMLFRPNKLEDELTERVQTTYEVMLKDKKRYEVATRSLEDMHQRIADTLNSYGLSAAHGSIRRARSLMDEMARNRAELRQIKQRFQSLNAQKSQHATEVELNEKKRRDILTSIGYEHHTSIETLQNQKNQLIYERDDISTTLSNAQLRKGELAERLARARSDHDFDLLKQREANLKTALHDETLSAVRYLIAQRVLAQSIAIWEERSQPLVYQHASLFFSQMTDGAWKAIRVSDAGEFEAIDVFDRVHELVTLSTGTLQQLYLSLRIALLSASPSVGSMIPIVCDDILVHFDDERRRGAARALAYLARERQVLLFTCHREVLQCVLDEVRDVAVLNL